MFLRGWFGFCRRGWLWGIWWGHLRGVEGFDGELRKEKTKGEKLSELE